MTPRLFHLWLSPFSRKVRIAMAELGMEVKLVIEPVWERRPEFLALNPAGTVPVLVEDDGTAIADSAVICEYLNETVAGRTLFGKDALTRAEVRRLVCWFDQKFHREVTDNLVTEKVMKRFMKMGTPDSSAGAAFSHKPQAGKLKALMNRATPRLGSSTWRD